MGPLRFTREHEWIGVEGDVGTVGITDYAQQQLGDIVFVEMPEIGAAVTKGTQAAVVESVKAASEVYAPASGEVVAINEALAEDPGLVNSAPHSDGWFFRIRLTDPAELDDLLDKAAYAAHVQSVA
ncbi:MAG: glycine cleavage system protein GcvH [Rhodospirillales bacterium]